MTTMLTQASWIKAPGDFGDVCPVFKKTFAVKKGVRQATIFLSALGLYEAQLNGKRVGDFILAPGWTAYQHRVQVQQYDITGMLNAENILELTLGRGWCCGELTWESKRFYPFDDPAVICALQLNYDDGTQDTLYSDESFQAARSGILYSHIYHGEVCDSRPAKRKWEPALVIDYPRDILIPQQGEVVREIEEIKPVRLITTPMNEKVLDFGQILTGYVKFRTTQPAGSLLEISHAEVLWVTGPRKGCFYTANLRGAKQRITYITNGQDTEYRPRFTYQGFRYIRLDKWTGDINPDDFTAVVVHSDIRRTGTFECSNEKVNRLFQNIIWSQRGNFLDIPTDCPQRVERLGWTGDAQVFIRAGSYNFDVQKFFTKWLADMALEQLDTGAIPAVIPDVLGRFTAGSAAWGDAAVICPWQLYLTYGDRDILAAQYDCMKKWVDCMASQTEDDIWDTGIHFGDWLALDLAEDSYRGATPLELIATAFLAYSNALFIKVGKILGRDTTDYEALYNRTVRAFQREFIKDGRMVADTQTAHVLALYFGLCGDSRQSVARHLAEMVTANGNRLTTGFVGTPYLLHALSDNGYAEIAYSLLLQEQYPSWLYCVNRGATTIWEHWNGIREDGSFWSSDGNSFNHYAYGAVADWMYGVVCGIRTDEDAPGFEHVVLKPVADRRLSFASASIDTRAGKLSSKWSIEGDTVTYEFEVPGRATIVIGEQIFEVEKGAHRYHSQL